MSAKSLLSIATGAGLGVFSAVLLQMDPAERAAAREPARETTVKSPTQTERVKPVETTSTAAPAEPAVLTASQTATPAARPADDGPKTPAEVTRAEMACDARDRTGCIRAALAYESGSVVPRNPALARTYRKRELTLVVRGCEARSPAACVTLSERYSRGEGVEQSERTAEALMRHAREICQLRRSPECENL